MRCMLVFLDSVTWWCRSLFSDDNSEHFFSRSSKCRRFFSRDACAACRFRMIRSMRLCSFSFSVLALFRGGRAPAGRGRVRSFFRLSPDSGEPGESAVRGDPRSSGVGVKDSSRLIDMVVRQWQIRVAKKLGGVTGVVSWRVVESVGV